MTPRVDPDARRKQISDAVIEEINADGIRSVTFARIAARTGLAIGSIRHYFGNNLREVMRFTLDTLVQRAQNRDVKLADAPMQRITDAIVFTAPTTEQECKENVALVEYRVMARTDLEFAAGIAEASAAATDAIHALLRQALDGRAIDEDELHAETRLLLALVEGFSFSSALASMPLQEADVRATASTAVRRLLDAYPPSAGAVDPVDID